MFSIIGIVVVFGAVVAGYLMEHGNLKVLMQPAELIIILGAAIGTVLIANPLHILKQIVSGVVGVFGGSKFSKQRYTESLKTMYEFLNKARREGLMSLEADVEDPSKSAILSKNPSFLKDHHIRDYFCDTMRMAISGVEAFDLDQLLELDMEVHHHEANQPIAALSSMADSLPGLGIVAAVLGVVITMGAIGGPPEEVGRKVAAALVGTFLGILLCYGLVGPLAANMTKISEDENAYLHVIRVMMVSFLKGSRSYHGGRGRTTSRSRPRSSVVRGGRKELSRWWRCNTRSPLARLITAHEEVSLMENSKRPIIIVKKKGGHAGHHGGAWKVAYADFVTAMMALFIVLWLLNTSKPVKEAVAGYFKDPSGSGDKTGTTSSGAAESVALTKDDMPKLKEKLEKAIQQIKDLDKLKNQIEITVTAEGLRIELLESTTSTFFDIGSPKLNQNGQELLNLLAQELGKLPNKISIEGHTDSKPYSGKSDYGNWELSTDRANSARRVMQQGGLGPRQVAQVRGYADQLLRKPTVPLDASNRRISMLVQNLETKNEDTKTESTSEKTLETVPKKE